MNRLIPWAVLAGTLVASPAPARVLVAGPSLADTLKQAVDGDVVEVPKGTYAGSFVVDRRITLRGKGAVLDGQGRGTVLRIEAAGAVVEGFSIQNGGTDLAAPDSCVYLAEKATGAVLRKNVIEGCGFGVWVHRTDKARILDNRVIGSLEGHRSNRGNGIQLFDASHLLVEGNVVTGGRDGIYVSATDDSVIRKNSFEKTRYGVHYMYSYRNTLEGNESSDSFSGFALMGSRYIRAHHNTASGNQEHGILLRDDQYCTIHDNVMEHDGVGLYVYSSTENRIFGNLMRGNEIGAKVWAGSVRNEVFDNEFVGNRSQVFYVSAEDLVWGKNGPGNYWGDYLGWDQDGDGFGDRPYRLDSFTASLIHRFPAAVLLVRSPALELLSHLEQTLPILRVPTIIDNRPRITRKQP